jgi:hypothetical protein
MIGGEEVDEPTCLYSVLDLIQLNMPNLSDLRLSNNFPPNANYIAYFLQFLG